MEGMWKDRVEAVRIALEKGICGKQAMIGFDGYVDEIYRVVKGRHTDGRTETYRQIADFGKRIIGAAGKNADLEIELREIRFGGNAPIMADAMAELGVSTDCIGQMDVETGESPFMRMCPRCRRISTGQSSRTLALEFDDGKVMLGNLRGKGLTWETVREKAGLSFLRRQAEESSLIGVVNWCGLENMEEIMGGLRQEVLARIAPERRREKRLFFDLADPSALSDEKLNTMVEEIRRAGELIRVSVGLNRNEACRLASVRKVASSCEEETGRELRLWLGAESLFLHTGRKSFCFTEGEESVFEGVYLEHPATVTGAGDHFNAGVCAGLLGGLNPHQALALGQMEASCYVESGRTPDRYRLLRFWERQKMGEES